MKGKTLSPKSIVAVGKLLREVFVMTDADANGDIRHREVGGKNGTINGEATDAGAGEFHYDEDA